MQEGIWNPSFLTVPREKPTVLPGKSTGARNFVDGCSGWRKMNGVHESVPEAHGMAWTPARETPAKETKFREKERSP